MTRNERTLRVLLIIFASLTLMLFALLFMYNFVLKGEMGNASLAENVTVEEILPVSITSGKPLNLEENEEAVAEVEEKKVERVDAYTKVFFESTYTLDGITLSSEEKLPHFALNLDKAKLSEVYPEWDIIEFSKEKVVMRKTVTNRHAEHYVISENDGFVAVFSRSGGAPLSLVEQTKTPVAKLSASEQSKIREGIIVYNEEMVHRLLQDFES